MDNPNNIGIYAIETLTAIDSDIIPFLDSPAGIAFERESSEASFKLSKDFSFGVEEE